MKDREIEFRAWDFENKRWIDNETLVIRIDGLAIFDRESGEELHNAILVQYTGLKDKNGKKIFEGYIVKFHTFKYVIKYVNGAFIAYHYNGLKDFDGSDLKWGGIWKFEENGFDIEIIGNICENSELMPEIEK